MPYQVPQHIDSDKIFLLNFSGLEGRLDPLYYREHFDFKDFCKLSSIAKVSGGKRIPLGKEYSSDPTSFLYLRVADIQEDGSIDLSGLKYIDENTYHQLKRYEIFNGDMAISIAGTIGKIVIVKGIPDNCHLILTENCAKITLQDAEVLTQYLQLVLSLPILQKQITLNYIQTTIPKLGLDRVSNLMLPSIPPINVQQEIIDYYYAELAQKTQKDKCAEAILNAIDDYVLNELGIHLPEAKVKVMEDRMFVVNYSEVSGGRLDPKCYSISTMQLKQSLFTSPFDKQPLRNFIESSCSGEWGKGETEEVDENKYTKCLVIRATEFDNTYNLRLDNSRVKYRWIEKSKLAKMDIRPNDLLIEKSGGSEDQPVGRVSILTNEILADNHIAYSNFIHKITVTGINPLYLYFYLKTMHNIKITDSMQSQTNGIRNLIMQEYLNLPIIVPPPQKQQEIADHITAIWHQAKVLQAEGNSIQKQAKQRIESMILGEY